jgi:hypothetical protein
MLPGPSPEASPPPGSGIDLAWEVTKLSARQTITVNAVLIEAYQAASSPHTILALKSDLEAFDLWCRRTKRIALPATPEIVADYLDSRAAQGARAFCD